METTKPLLNFTEDIAMKLKISTLLITALLSMGATAHSVAATDTAPGVQNASAFSSSAKMTAGEVRKIDIEQMKVTIKHEALENLDMPGMTMVFKATDSDLLKGFKQGDKILFRAEKLADGFTVVKLEHAK